MAHGQNVVHLNSEAEIEEAKTSSRTLSKYANTERLKMSLRGRNGESDELVLPGPVLQVLLNVLSEMGQGNAISLIPHHQEVSTQEAADLLSVSRPHLVKLLEAGDIPFRKVGSHRRALLTDILKYKEAIDADREKSLDVLVQLSQSEGGGYEF